MTTKQKLRQGQPALGGWIMIPHPAVAEIMAGEGFDWVAVDLEHTSTDLQDVHQIALALKGTRCELLARLPSCDPVLAKRVLDTGARGIIVPSVNTPEQAAQAVAMSRFPPAGTRGASLCRATDFGRDFAGYFARANDEVLVVIMLEHRDAIERADAILATPGIDAAMIGPYDLSASMGLPGQLTHPAVQEAQQLVRQACTRHRVAPGLHVVAAAPAELRQRLEEGFLFLACSLDTLFIQEGCRRMLQVCQPRS